MRQHPTNGSRGSPGIQVHTPAADAEGVIPDSAETAAATARAGCVVNDLCVRRCAFRRLIPTTRRWTDSCSILLTDGRASRQVYSEFLRRVFEAVCPRSQRTGRRTGRRTALCSLNAQLA